MQRLFFSLESRAICDGVIAFNRGKACVKTACLCPHSQGNRKFFAPNNKVFDDSNKIFGWNNCLLIIFSLVIHSCL